MNSPTAIAGSANRSSGTRGRRQPYRLRVEVRGGHDVRRVAVSQRALALLRPRVVLLLGTLAIERLWGKGPLDALVGRSRRAADGTLLIPLPHPSGASRWLNDVDHRDLLQRGLRLLKRTARSVGP